MSRLEQLTAFLAQNPKDSFLCFAVAKEHEGMGNMEQALEFYQKLQETDPMYVGTYYHLGKLQEKMGLAGQALQTYREGMEVAKKLGDRHALSELAAAKMELSDEDDEN